VYIEVSVTSHWFFQGLVKIQKNLLLFIVSTSVIYQGYNSHQLSAGCLKHKLTTYHDEQWDKSFVVVNNICVTIANGCDSLNGPQQTCSILFQMITFHMILLDIRFKPRTCIFWIDNMSKYNPKTCDYMWSQRKHAQQE
jgi:hypothetical protein